MDATREIAHLIARHPSAASRDKALGHVAKETGMSKAAARREWDRLSQAYPALARIPEADRLARNIHDRLSRHLLARAERVVTARGLSRPTGWEWDAARIRDRGQGMTLVGAEYWYEYSRRFGSRLLGAAYLIGRDDSGEWAIRVPVTVNTVAEALEWSIPADVRRAEAEGRHIFRQGDVFLVPLKTGRDNLVALAATRHEMRPYRQGRALVHPEHKPVYVPRSVGAVRAYAARSMESGGRSRFAD